MFNVLIMDDEPLIRQGLKTIIDWNSYGFQICGEAEDGQEGLAKVLEIKPDLIVADIKMPGMDGLKMIERLRESNTECKIIILSGYSDFDYARRALEFGVESYLLKPIDEEELIAKVKKVRDAIANTKNVKDIFEEGMFSVRDRIMGKLISDSSNVDKAEKYNELLNLRLPWKSYQILLVEADGGHNEQIKLEAARGRIEDFLSEYYDSLVFGINGKIAFLLKNRVYSASCCAIKSLHKDIMDISGVTATIAIGSEVNNISEIKLSYQHAYDLLRRKFVLGPGRILSEEADSEKNEYELSQDAKEYIDTDDLVEKLYIAADVNNVISINDTLEKYRVVMSCRNFTSENIKVSYTEMFTSLVNRIMLANPDIRWLEDICRNVFAEISKAPSLHKLHGYIKYNIVSISDELAKERPDSLMKKILDYIERNYNRQIKLSTLGEVFNYNSTYLGKLFKNFTGESFNTYLDRVRVDKAKEFLALGHKVKEVSEMTGYSDINYFYSKFRKYTGTSPSSYKGPQN